MKINGRLIGKNYPPYIIAEMSNNHLRDLDKAKKILIGYVESIIIDLEEKIKNQRARIDMIKNVQIDPK